MKYKKWLVRTFIGIILLAILKIGFETLTMEYSKKFVSSNKSNSIKIETINLSFLMFGPSAVRIQCRKNNFIGFMNGVNIDTTIANDGKNINDSNVEVEWINEDIAIVTLSGEEQENEVIKIKFKDNISYE